MKAQDKPLIAIYHEHLRGGGATQVVLYLTNSLLAAGYAVDLVVNDRSGNYARHVPDNVDIVSLTRSSQEWTRLHMLRAAIGDADLLARSVFIARKKLDKLLFLPALTRYLRRRRPALLISNLWQLALAAISARAISSPETAVTCIFHSSYFYQCAQSLAQAKRPRKWHRLLGYCRAVYSRADALVAVSEGIGRDLTQTVGVPRATVQTIYNPVVPTNGIPRPSPPDHPWLRDSEVPVIVAVGRFSPEKNLHELLRAFAGLRERQPARLIILGEGSGRAELTALSRQLGLQDAIDLPGWVDDASAFLSHADLYVLSSQWEGLGNGLIEALACGCPIVAYDCAHGPREILDNGRYGDLVSVGDVSALTDAMEVRLDKPKNRDVLRLRAMDFAIERGVAHYLDLVTALTTGTHRPAPTDS